MQPSELWRRGVVMPLTAEAAEQIAGWDVNESTAVEFLSIADRRCSTSYGRSGCLPRSIRRAGR